MGQLGSLIALNDDDARVLRACRDDASCRTFVVDVLQEREFDSQWYCSTDKAWDALHRCLAAGTLDPAGGTYPLNHVILGGEQLHRTDNFIISCKTPAQVRDIALALADVDIDSLRILHNNLDADDYGAPLDDEHLEYMCGYFANIVAFYQRAAAAGRGVVFSVDQ